MNLIKYIICMFTILYVAGAWNLNHDYTFGAIVLITAIYMLIRPYQAWIKNEKVHKNLDKKEEEEL